MKHVHTLGLTLCLIGVFALLTMQPATAQETTKVIVVKKKTDAEGQQTFEKIVIHDGEDLHEILADSEAEHAVTADRFIIIQDDCKTTKADCAKICVKNNNVNTNIDVNQNVNVNVNEDNDGKIIEIDVDGEKETIRLAKGEKLSDADRERLEAKGVYLNHENGMTWVGDNHDFDFDLDFDFELSGLSEGLVAMGKELAHIGEGHAYAVRFNHSDINCAALGVYVSTSQSGGVYINSTIDASGAEEAGLLRGDVIKSIDDSPTGSYGQLHEVLARYEPGDVVAVTYVRDGVEDRVETQLRAWRDFPSFANSRHAMVTCDKTADEVVTKRIIVVKKDRVEEEVDEPAAINESPYSPIDNSLMLTDFVAYPNPTEGKFRVQFTAEAVPTVVSVFDASGKEIFRDNVDRFSGVYNREIDLTAQVRGGLVLSVEQDGKTFTEQIILH